MTMQLQNVIFYFFFSDVVKVLEDGDLQTLGLLDYDKRLKHSFTAHPKVDPFTGTLQGYRHSDYFLFLLGQFG
jgi:carotenoid cleavage dioxygenase